MDRKNNSITDIFKAIGQPTVTYVERESGHYEKLLSDAIESKGQLCLVTGASKTGKTTLYKRVLEQKRREPLIIRCDRQLTPTEFWKKGLEQLDFERICQAQKQRGSVLSGSFGWKWLAGLAGDIGLSASKSASEAEIRERVLSAPSPDHLLIALKNLPTTLIVEDFHYLEDETKTIIFQQWKNFIDNEVSVVVLGTTHRAIDIANSNQDLLGRICQIDVTTWDEIDLAEIARKGFEHLGVTLSETVVQFIARESVGLPIITQQVCLQLFLDKEIHLTHEIPKSTSFSTNDSCSALVKVANHKYRQLGHHYRTIKKGPRQKARKYNTYEMLMLCFAQDPLRFSLSRYEIDQRLGKLGDVRPPRASVTSTLAALAKFQSQNDFTILEWRPKEKMLYMLEPAFLFYVRWRENRDTEPFEPGLFDVIVHFTGDGVIDKGQSQTIKSVNKERILKLYFQKHAKN